MAVLCLSLQLQQKGPVPASVPLKGSDSSSVCLKGAVKDKAAKARHAQNALI